jgi:hypothetical protein
MGTDRYTRIMLTVIAVALVYLCVVLTPLPVALAQPGTGTRPGELTAPAQVIVIGWRAPEAVPVTASRPLPVDLPNPVRVQGQVTTERSSGRADRVVVVGWEENAQLDRGGSLRPIDVKAPAGLPVSVVPPR